MIWQPRTSCHRNILAIDVEGSTRRTDPVKREIRDALYESFERALNTAGLTDQCRDPLIDRGDGVLALVHPVDQAPRILLDAVIGGLGTLVAEHNVRRPAQRFRLRAVLHAGEVQYDERGCFGETLDVAFRLLDAGTLKRALRMTHGPMVLVASDDIYRGVIRHSYDGIDPDAFEGMVRVHVAGWRHRGWVHAVETTAVSKTPARAGDRVISIETYPRRA